MEIRTDQMALCSFKVGKSILVTLSKDHLRDKASSTEKTGAFYKKDLLEQKM